MKKKLLLLLVTLCSAGLLGLDARAQDATTPATLDVTKLFVANPSFETGDLTGWTVQSGDDSGVKVGNAGGTYGTEGVHGTYLFNIWWQGYPIHQTVTNLPAGTYTLSALGASSATCYFTIYANDASNGDADLGHTTTPLGDGGFVDCSTTFTTDAATNVTIGVRGSNTADSYGDNFWYKTDNFRLTLQLGDDGAVPTALTSYIESVFVNSIFITQTVKSDYQSALATYSTNPTDGNRAALQTAMNTMAESSYYLYNERTGKFLSRGKNWGTRAIADDYGVPVQFVSSGDAAAATYYLKFLDGSGYLSDAAWLYTDGGDTRKKAYLPVVQEDGSYWLRNQDASLTDENNLLYVYLQDGNEDNLCIAGNGKLGENISAEGQAKWKLLTETERTAVIAARQLADHKAIATAAGITGVETEEDFTSTLGRYYAIDVTSTYLDGATLAGSTSGWTYTKGRTNANWNAGIAATNGCVESFYASGTMAKSLTGLPEGIYKVTLNGFYRASSNATCWINKKNGFAVSNAYLKAGDYAVAFKDWASGAEQSGSNFVPNDLSEANTKFAAGAYPNEVYTYVGADGNLSLLIDQQNYVANCWLAYNNMTLTRYVDPAKAKAELSSVVTANIGDGAFQYAQSAIDGIINGLGDAPSYEDILAANTRLQNLKYNAPANETGYVLKLRADDTGYAYNDKAVTYIAYNRNDHGLWNINYNFGEHPNYAQAFFFVPVADEDGVYKLYQLDVDGKQRYLCVGTVYGGDNYQLRTTLDETQALKVRVDVPKSQEVGAKLYNTAAGAYIGSRDAGFYTVAQNNHFRITAANKLYIDRRISQSAEKDEWYTWLSPIYFNFYTGSIVAYKATEVNGTVVTLEEMADNVVPACVPALICVKAGNGNLSTIGVSGYGAAPGKDEFTNGVLAGTLVAKTLTPADNAWLLQDGASGIGFYKVKSENGIEVPAYRAWVSHDETAAAQEGNVKGLTFVIKDGESTAISTPDATAPAAVAGFYSLSGARQDGLQKGINIVRMTDGTVRKVMVK